MEEVSDDLAFVQGWRERSSEFSSESNDELSTVITRALEVLVSALRPNSSVVTVRRLLTSLENERNLSLRYDMSNNGIRAMTYGLVESMEVTILNLLDANQRIKDSKVVSHVIHDGIMPQDVFIIPNQLALSPLPIIKIDEGDFEDRVENNQPTTSRNDLANEGDKPAEILPLLVPTGEEEEIEQKPVIVKRKRGRPRKERLNTAPKSEEKAKENSGSTVGPSLKKVKIEVDDNVVPIRETRRVKRERTDGGYPEIQANIGRAVPVKKEILDGLVEGNDCLVCGKRLMRRLRGYVDHHTSHHGFTMQEHRYYLVCECGEIIERSSDARTHDKKCGKLGYTVHRKEPSSSIEDDE